MSPAHNDTEQDLRELFSHQADAINSTAPAWDDTPTTTLVDLDSERTRRRRRGGILAAVATVAAVVVTVVAIGSRTTRVTTVPAYGPGGAPTPVSWNDGRVHLSAENFAIVADGKTFTAQNADVSISSDPGDAKYTTLELGWQENGVTMSMNIYFASDGHDWWATEIRTYNGKANGDWIEYTGDRFRTPIGQPFTGNLDLSHGDARLYMGGLQLEAFVRPKACDAPVAARPKYIVVSNYDPVDFNGGISAAIYDGATCTQIQDQTPFTASYASADPSIAKIVSDTMGNPPDCTTCPTRADVTMLKAGDTTGTVTIRMKATGEVVGSATFQVHSKAAAAAANGVTQPTG
jgi:hypothetical protein